MNRAFRTWIYLLLLVLGVVVPLTQFVPWLASHGLDVPLLLHQLFANRISSFFALDTIFSATTFLVFVVLEQRRVRWWPVTIPLTLLIGVSAALPTLLFLREISRERRG